MCSTLIILTRNISRKALKTMSTSPGAHSVVYVTAPSDDVAKKLARSVVQNKLAACVNVVPKITSIYDWQNEIHEDEESLLMIKTRTDLVDMLTKFVKENHPYEICEVISLQIDAGNEQYLHWINQVLSPSAQLDN